MIWKLLKQYVRDVEITNKVHFTNDAWDRIKQLEQDVIAANRVELDERLQIERALLTENRELRAAHLEIYRLVMFQSSGYALEIGNIIHKALGLKDDESPRDYLRTTASAESEV